MCSRIVNYKHLTHITFLDKNGRPISRETIYVQMRLNTRHIDNVCVHFLCVYIIYLHDDSFRN